MYFDENNNYFDIMMTEQEYEFNKNYNKNENNDIDVNVNIDSINFNREGNLYSPLEGFNKGNMFQNLFICKFTESAIQKINKAGGKAEVL